MCDSNTKNTDKRQEQGQEASRLLSNLGLKIPLSKILLIFC